MVLLFKYKKRKAAFAYSIWHCTHVWALSISFALVRGVVFYRLQI